MKMNFTEDKQEHYKGVNRDYRKLYRGFCILQEGCGQRLTNEVVNE
jgi:hypothetical protein